jgi:hypothetical protein
VRAVVAGNRGQVTNKDATKYVLTTLDELCKENREIAQLFGALAGTELDPINVVSQLISRDDEILVLFPLFLAPLLSLPPCKYWAGVATPVGVFLFGAGM